MFTCRTSANIVVLSFLILLSTTAKAESEAVMKQLNYSGYELMTRLVNDSRKLNGRPKLCTSQYICRLIMGNRKLMNSAQKHSDYQASIRRMTHESPTPLFDRFTQAGFKAQAVAENVAMMSSFTVEGVMRLWIGSPGHFANILGEYSFLGSGVAKGSDGRYYWTQHFARPFRDAVEVCLGDVTSPTTTKPPAVTTTKPAPSVVIVTVTVTSRPKPPPAGSDRIPWHWPWRRSFSKGRKRR